MKPTSDARDSAARSTPAQSSEAVPETDRDFQAEAREMLRQVDKDFSAVLGNLNAILGSCVLTLFFITIAFIVTFEQSFTLRGFGFEEAVITGRGAFIVSLVFIGFGLASTVLLAKALKLDRKGLMIALFIASVPPSAFVANRYVVVFCGP